MPSDIRSFFGSKPAGAPAAKAAAPAKQENRKRGRPKKIVSDDEDEEPAPIKSTPKRTTPRKKFEPVLEETTASDFFPKGNKPKRTEVTKAKSQKPQSKESTPKKGRGRPKANGAAVNGKATEDHALPLDPNDFADDDVDDEADDQFKAAAKVGKKMDDDYEKGTDDSDDGPSILRNGNQANGKQKRGKAGKADEFDADNDIKMKDHDFTMSGDDEEIVTSKPARSTPARAGRKRKSTTLDIDDDFELDVEEAKPVKAKSSPSKRATPAKKQKKEELQNSATVQAIFDSIPTIEPPPPPPKNGDDAGKPKFQYGAHANSAVPAAALDMSELPQGEENCLAGLSFVFTGQLDRLGREQGQSLVKQYGGKVTGAPSKKTSYVVLGQDAGPKKLETIKQHGLKVINEEGLFELIRKLPANGGDSVAAEKQAEKRAKEEEEIRKAAAEMERQEKARLAAVKPKPNAPSSNLKQSPTGSEKGKAPQSSPQSQLWTVRYAPQSLSQICGNNTQVQKLQRWLRAFPANAKKGFKLAGPDGSGTHRAVIIHGPPGIGKTTAAHLVAKMEGYDVVESNASDTRSKKLVETGLKGVLSTTSLMGYFAPGADKVEASKKKLVLIMDEVDGMSAGDRGGVGALAAVCKKTQIPMILICNDRKLPKMAPFNYVTYDLPFRRPTADQIRSRISTIAFREGLKIPPNVINKLIEGSGADIRQVVNMISTVKLDSQAISFEEGSDMSKAWEKHTVLKPWDMVGKILGGGLFNPASKSSLNDKQELYFNDHEFAPLMLQENYLGTNPQRTNKFADPRKKRLASLELISQASDSISDGDLTDRMIHGSQQQWSLMPTHAMFSFVRPASFVYGSMAGQQTRFTAWLGKNSNQGKLMRFLKEVQGHMRLRISGDRFEVRQTYLPMLWDRLIKRLEVDGKEAVPEIIQLMDDYYLTKDDWDAILELGLGKNDMENVKIETAAKSTFTRLYNQQSHPLPFIKASQVLNPKRAPSKEKPDLEEALEESDEGEAVDDAEVKAEDEEEVDLSKDKYVKQPKKKKATAAKADKAESSNKGKGKGKKKATADEDDFVDDDDEEDIKPKKGKGKGKRLIPKADRKKIHEYLFREGVLVAKKDYESKHGEIDTKNLYVVKACQSLTSRGYLKTQFSWQWYYYTLTPEGLDYLREWLHLPAEIVPQTHVKQQRSHAPPRGMGGDDRERRGGGRGGPRGDREGYRRRDMGDAAPKGEGAPGGFNPEFRGGFGRGRGAPPS